MADFRKKSSKGNLAIRQLETKVALCTQRVGHTYSDDGVIRFGDVIMLQHNSSGHYLCNDPFDEFLPGSFKFHVGCTQSDIPMARSTFRIVRPPSQLESVDNDPNDPILKVGQPFCLMCNEALLVKPNSKLLAPPLYLCSTKKNERNATKTTNRQLTYMSPLNDSESIWFVVQPSQGRANCSERFLSNGTPVSIDDTYLITHRQTNCCLVCDDKQRDQTDFGVETECYADRANEFGKLSLMMSEFKGISTAYTLSKPDANMYFWNIRTNKEYTGDNMSGFPLEQSTSPSTHTLGHSASGMLRNTSTAALQNAPSVDDLLDELRGIIGGKGLDGFWSLRAFFFAADSEFDGKIDRIDLKDGLIYWGVGMDPRYIDKIIDLVDTKKTNSIVDFSKFMTVVRGSIAQDRQTAIEKTWNLLDRSRKGFLVVDDVSGRFDTHDHPLFTLGRQSHENIWKHFLLLCKSKKPYNVAIKNYIPTVSKNAFTEYYCDLSAGLTYSNKSGDIDNRYFEEMVSSNWKTFV